MDGDLAFRLAELRGQISDLGGAIRQLQRSGLDSASAQLLITRKRAELECLMSLRSGADHHAGNAFCIGNIAVAITHQRSDADGVDACAAAGSRLYSRDGNQNHLCLRLLLSRGGRQSGMGACQPSTAPAMANS